ncbi:MAG TPA: hypothetical protein VM347_03035 [Nonomuraea sp.]|nr:hypothetical protein [Nonomuraea sp.]
MSYTIRPLDASTWAAFAEFVERNNGIFGGCWCIGYHPECGQKGIRHRAVKEDRVRTGRAHAALVLDEDGAVQGWCQYGSPEAPEDLGPILSPGGRNSPLGSASTCPRDARPAAAGQPIGGADQPFGGVESSAADS